MLGRVLWRRRRDRSPVAREAEPKTSQLRAKEAAVRLWKEARRPDSRPAESLTRGLFTGSPGPRVAL